MFYSMIFDGAADVVDNARQDRWEFKTNESPTSLPGLIQTSDRLFPKVQKCDYCSRCGYPSVGGVHQGLSRTVNSNTSSRWTGRDSSFMSSIQIRTKFSVLSYSSETSDPHSRASFYFARYYLIGPTQRYFLCHVHKPEGHRSSCFSSWMCHSIQVEWWSWPKASLTTRGGPSFNFHNALFCKTKSRAVLATHSQESPIAKMVFMISYLSW